MFIYTNTILDNAIFERTESSPIDSEEKQITTNSNAMPIGATRVSPDLTLPFKAINVIIGMYVNSDTKMRCCC